MKLEELYKLLENVETKEEINKIRKKISAKKYYEQNKKKIVNDVIKWRKKNKKRYLEVHRKNQRDYRERKKAENK